MTTITDPRISIQIINITSTSQLKIGYVGDFQYFRTIKIPANIIDTTVSLADVIRPHITEQLAIFIVNDDFGQSDKLDLLRLLSDTLSGCLFLQKAKAAILGSGSISGSLIVYENEKLHHEQDFEDQKGLEHIAREGKFIGFIMKDLSVRYYNQCEEKDIAEMIESMFKRRRELGVAKTGNFVILGKTSKDLMIKETIMKVNSSFYQDSIVTESNHDLCFTGASVLGTIGTLLKMFIVPKDILSHGKDIFKIKTINC